MANRKHTRQITGLAMVLTIAAFLAYAFWPRATLVDLAIATRAPMIVTINEEGRTQVHDPYTLSTPVAGRLMRVEVEPGDAVEKDKSIVARMLPTSPVAP